MPLVKEGRLTALMAIHHRQPHDWTAGELALITEVTERSWAHIERVRDVAQLATSEAQFRSMAEAMPNHAWTATPDGLLDWLNDRAYSYAGALPGTLLGNDWIAIVHPDDVDAAATQWAAALAEGRPYEAEFRLRRHDGQWRWHIARAAPIRDASGEVLRWVGTNTDIQDQKESMAALQELNADLEAKVIAQSLARGRTWQVNPNLMGVANPEGYFEATNPAWETILGWTSEEVARTYLFDFVHPDDMKATEGALAALIRNEPLLPFENRYRRKDGSYRWISWVAVPEGGNSIAPAATSPKRRNESPSCCKHRKRCASRRKWRRSASSPAGSRTTSTICCRASPARWIASSIVSPKAGWAMSSASSRQRWSRPIAPPR